MLCNPKCVFKKFDRNLLIISILREILAIFYKAAYISDVLTTWVIILFLESKCTILGSKDAKVEGESLFTELTCVHATNSLGILLPEK